MLEVVFPPKVSGFYKRKDGPPALLPVASLLEGLNGLDAIEASWDFIDMSDFPDYSYHCCYIKIEGEHFFFFMNKYHYLGAFSRIEDVTAWEQWQKGELLPRNHYVDIPEAKACLDSTWTVIPEPMLIQSVDADNEISQKIVMNLQNDEFAEFAYWEPQNMGNILFNNWKKY